MKVLKKVLNFYIDGSIHVAFSVYCLLQISYFLLSIPANVVLSYFAFFGTIVGYNFVKYESFLRTKKPFGIKIKSILFLSILSFLAVGFFFLQLKPITQLVSVGLFLATLLYTLPFFPNRKNARNWAGVKIYMVSLCWVGVALVLPIIDSGIAITADLYFKGVQLFIFVFVLILIFEILDLTNDDPHLQTVPQQIGVKRTKKLGYFLLVVFCILGFLIDNFQFLPLLFEIVIAIAIASFLAFANEKRSKYYTSFWVESIPVWWWILYLFLYHK